MWVNALVDYIILHCMNFNDEFSTLAAHALHRELRKKGTQCDCFNLPKSDNYGHNIAFSLFDLNRFCTQLICIDFPSAFVRHERKVLIQTCELPTAEEYSVGVNVVLNRVTSLIDVRNDEFDNAIQMCMEKLL